MSWDDVQDWRESWGKEKTEKKERKGKADEDKQRKRREKQKRKRERGARPEKERRRKKVAKTKQIERNGESGRKVESFLSAVASKYGGALRPITTGKRGRMTTQSHT